MKLKKLNRELYQHLITQAVLQDIEVVKFRKRPASDV